MVADLVEHYPGLVEEIVSVNSLYNKTDSSLEGVSSYHYYHKEEWVGNRRRFFLWNFHGVLERFWF